MYRNLTLFDFYNQGAFLERVSSENPGVPCFLFGHSTGGAVVLKVPFFQYLILYHYALFGIFSSPTLRNIIFQKKKKKLLETSRF